MRVIRLLALVLCAAAMVRAADNPLAGLLAGENLQKLQATGVEVTPGPRPDSVVLTFPASDTAGLVVIPIPAAARDFTRYRTFTFEFTDTATLKWDLALHNAKGQSFTFRVMPYENVPVRAAISSRYLLHDYMNNTAFKAYWMSNWANHIELTNVESITVRMAPSREVKLTLGPFALDERDVPDEFYIGKPVIDGFGQWAEGEWQGKAHSLDELRASWSRENEHLKEANSYGQCPMGGWNERKERATGYFHVAEVDGKWWLVDPHGHLFFSAGMDCVRAGDNSRVTGREALFARLPAGVKDAVNFLLANARQRYGDGREQAAWLDEGMPAWKAKQIERLRAWGFNTVANWSDATFYLKPEMPFVTNAEVGRSARNWQGYPDAYSAEFAQQAAGQAEAMCGRFKNEPLLIGYFIGNEPHWHGRNLIDLILNDPAASETQKFVKTFLASKGDSPAARDALLETLARKYHQVVVEAIRKADPNHLVLGFRYAGGMPDAVLRANDVFDVFSINTYRFEPDAKQIAHIYDVVKKPILIGEFHFGAAERGMAPSLVEVKDQEQRGIAYQYYVEHAAALAPVIGTHYFQWYDEPVSGRYDGENYNLGFVNDQDIPYPLLVRLAIDTHKRIYLVHDGKRTPTERKAEVR